MTVSTGSSDQVGKYPYEATRASSTRVKQDAEYPHSTSETLTTITSSFETKTKLLAFFTGDKCSYPASRVSFDLLIVCAPDVIKFSNPKQKSQ